MTKIFLARISSSGQRSVAPAGCGCRDGIGPELAACSSDPSVAELTGGPARRREIRASLSGSGRKQRSAGQCRNLSTVSDAPSGCRLTNMGEQLHGLGPECVIASVSCRSSKFWLGNPLQPNSSKEYRPDDWRGDHLRLTLEWRGRSGSS